MIISDLEYWENVNDSNQNELQGGDDPVIAIVFGEAQGAAGASFKGFTRAYDINFSSLAAANP